MYAILIALLPITTSYAQSLSQVVVASSGATISGASNTLSFTAGEATVGTISSGDSLAQGFWLGAIVEITLSNEDFTLEVQTTAYPNPVTDYLNLNFNELAGQDFEVTLYNTNGKQVFRKELKNSSTNETLDFQSYSTGMYVLNILQRVTNKSKTIKIIKQ